LPCVESIEKVHVTGSAAQNLERQLALLDVCSCGSLMRVDTISESYLLFTITCILSSEVFRDRVVIVGSVLERFQGVQLSALIRDTTRLELLQEIMIRLRFDKDSDPSVVLSCSTE